MAGELSILGAIVRLGEMVVAVKIEEHEAMKRAALIVEKEAKREIGHYQEEAGPFAAWAMLADSTVAEKQALGYAPPDNPLLRKGDLRDSIGHAVSEAGAFHAEAVVGSNSDIAVYQELGTEKMPPRSFLGGAAVRSGKKVAEAVGGGVIAALIGREVINGHLPLIGSE
ncbi:MAG TPA: hypothetical protein VNE18_01600 [Rhodanobacter sp.]|nr:hypothetical protein [Rhodanobacter sp.]